MRKFKALCLAVLILAACARQKPAENPAPPKPDVLITDMDTSVSPGDDFFQYANGGWLKRNPIPASESAWGIGNVVRDDIYAQLRTIDETAAKQNAAPGTDEQKIGDFWVTAMDEAKADQLRLMPLKAELDRIDAIATPQDAINEAFALQRIGIDGFFGFYIAQDEKQSDVMSVHLQQGGLGLPDRDFYFNKEAGVAKIRTEYLSHLQKMLALTGEDDKAAAASAAKIMEFETALASASRKLEDLRDPQRNYNKMTPAEVRQKHTPSIAWEDRLGGWNIHPSYVIVGQPEFFTGLESLLKKTPVPVLRDYLRYHLVSEFAAYLSKDIDAEDFNFYHRVLSGQPEPLPRWKRVLNSENGAIGMVLGRIFVKQYFPESSKKRYSDLVEAIRTAYNERIDRLDWMSDATKAKAHQKLAAITKKVGYPDKWKDYSALIIGRSSYCENMMSAARWNFDDMLSKFGKPVDRTEWQMSPQTYNAYYNPSNNEIVLPAAAFEIPGLRDSEIDDAIAYGYAGGSTIGHEITHGFDDEGRQYDAAGNLTDWWTKEDAEKFKKRADVMVKQFNAYEPLPGLHINGAASLGENIADYGGILLGLDAFKKTDEYKKGEKIAGLTPTQRYFLGYALSWLDQQREELLRRRLLSDFHAPAKWRVIGPLANVPEFYDAFGIKQGQSMWRPDDAHVQIW
jgi:putative endopeptidase